MMGDKKQEGVLKVTARVGRIGEREAREQAHWRRNWRNEPVTWMAEKKSQPGDDQENAGVMHRKPYAGKAFTLLGRRLACWEGA